MTDVENKNPSVESVHSETLTKIENEINELKDDNESTSDEIEHLDWLLTREFSDFLWKDNAKRLLDNINRKYPGHKDLPDWLQDLINFLEPIWNGKFNEEFNISDLKWISWLENWETTTSKFYNWIDKNGEKESESKIQETLNHINQIIEEYQDILSTENNIKTTLENVKKVLENPTKNNVIALQSSIYANLNTDEQKNFIKENWSYSNNTPNFDWKFGKSTLQWTNKGIEIIKNRLKDLDEAKKVMDTHEEINAQKQQEAKAEQQRIDIQKQREQSDVTTLVNKINTSISNEKTRIENLDIDTVFNNYPLKGSKKIDREINMLKHINNVQEQAKYIESQRNEARENLTTTEWLDWNNRAWKRSRKKRIREYENAMRERGLKYNELKHQEDLETPIEERISTQLNKIKDEYESQFKKLNNKVKNLKWAGESDFNNPTKQQINLISNKQQKNIQEHGDQITKCEQDMNKILSFLWSKYEAWKFVDDPNKTSDFEKFIGKYNVNNSENESTNESDTVNINNLLKDKSSSDFLETDNSWSFKLKNDVISEEWNIKYVTVWDHKFQLCESDTIDIKNNLVCIVSWWAIYFASYKDWKIDSNWTLLHSVS